ncbi:alcohol dehydrogenase GroES domain protein [Coniophora puteana RWD-64-598 SS2]|uniref:Alcohol dehydrogenase GroES domain protein n=1 Tax=Coniophora puteana (strain RWD-64-598) TaxID=741705 RepID=A0A5M3N8T7_CONPW|nr:alcohol dehydrogenase GroES domain protein [Coniophora puteana RWD-64-598 SS2]EIW87271.1 alcohol dehydrogenase GroES domain protein [Coniophora puteana RWD-64-598 SS2]
MTLNGICGSDLHMYLHVLSGVPTLTEPDKLTGETLPITMGHEMSGTIVDIGGDVDPQLFPIGSGAVVEPVLSCMKATCNMCVSGTRNLCPDVNFIGVGGRGGGLAEYIVVDAYHVHPLPHGFPLDVAALLEPLAVASRAVRRSGFKSSDTILISGGGPIGILILKVLRSTEPDTIIVISEPSETRRRTALEHGCTSVIDPSRVDAVLASQELTQGIGYDIAFDAAGAQAALDANISSLRTGGKLILVALWPGPPRLNVNLCLTKELTIIHSNAYSGEHPGLIKSVADGRISGLDKLITARVALEDVVDKGMQALVREKDSHVKILIHP